jgi:hypothetical protein
MILGDKPLNSEVVLSHKIIAVLNTLHASCNFFCFCYVLDVILRLIVEM